MSGVIPGRPCRLHPLTRRNCVPAAARLAALLPVDAEADRIVDRLVTRRNCVPAVPLTRRTDP
jgi:hypothetical protein